MVVDLRAAGDDSKKKVDEMVGGGGRLLYTEAFVFDAEMIRILCVSWCPSPELLGQLTRRVEALETKLAPGIRPGAARSEGKLREWLVHRPGEPGARSRT